jgi:cation transport regulator ChaB
VLQNDRAQLIEGAAEQALHAFRPQRDGEVRRADDVDEEARHDAAFGALGYHHGDRSTRTFITGPPRSACSMPA